MPSPSRQLGEFLVDRKVLSRSSLEELLAREAAEGVALARILTAEGLVSEKDLVAAVAHQVGVPFVDLGVTPVNPLVDRVLPAELAQRHTAVGVDISGNDLVVAMANPGDRAAVAAIEEASGWKVAPALAVRREIERVVASMYGAGGSAQSPVASGAPAPAAAHAGDEIVISAVADPVANPLPPRSDEVDRGDELHINELLQRVLDLGGSDLHLTVGIHPSVRVNGEIKPLTEFPKMNGSEIRRMVYGVLTQKQRERFENDLELDTSHSIPGVGRFRMNVFLQRDSVGTVMRTIPWQIVSLDRLGLPPSVSQFAQLQRGLVLVTGPTGSGKSTTLASMVDVINSTKPVHIMTVEDPIEFLHFHKRSVVNQREVGEDTNSFASALKHVLRQDPDVILVGEMRDLETISTAITAAETGHLVFATLHTQDAPQTIDRVIDVFPGEQQQQVRVQLAAALQGVVTQQLIPLKSGQGRVAAAEVLVATPAIRNLIREGKTHQVYSALQAGGKYGMQTMDQSLASLIKQGLISMDIALERCANEDDLRRLLGGGA